jgi:hypothetical protein
MTFRSTISWSISSLLLAARVLAEPLPYRAAFDVQEVGTNAGGWRVAGAIADDTVAGFDGWGVRTNFLVACESSLGDVDLYRIESIATQGVAWLDCVVSYRGTGTAARVGAPTFGQALVCYAAGTNDIPLTQYAGPSGPSMYLKDALAAVALARLAAAGGVPGPAGADGAPGPQGEPGPAGLQSPLTNIAGLRPDMACTNVGELTVADAWGTAAGSLYNGAGALYVRDRDGELGNGPASDVPQPVRHERAGRERDRVRHGVHSAGRHQRHRCAVVPEWRDDGRKDHAAGGVHAAGTSPLKFQTGSLMTGAEYGAVEFLSRQALSHDQLGDAGAEGVGDTGCGAQHGVHPLRERGGAAGVFVHLLLQRDEPQAAGWLQPLPGGGLHNGVQCREGGRVDAVRDLRLLELAHADRVGRGADRDPGCDGGQQADGGDDDDRAVVDRPALHDAHPRRGKRRAGWVGSARIDAGDGSSSSTARRRVCRRRGCSLWSGAGGMATYAASSTRRGGRGDSDLGGGWRHRDWNERKRARRRRRSRLGYGGRRGGGVPALRPRRASRARAVPLHLRRGLGPLCPVQPRARTRAAPQAP